MRSLWDEAESKRYTDALGLRVYTSQLLGRDKTLVLHGGGNTSVKICERNVYGEPEDLLYVKGSGWDLETIQAAGFAPVRMAPLLKLAQLPTLTDAQMVNELRVNCVRAAAPAPSVETILHAVLPYTYVDHTHADAILAITNTPHGESLLAEIYGDDVVILPYVMPGFDLARQVALEFPRRANAKTQGMILLKHGIFSFGATAQAAYERMIDLVHRAETFLQQRSAWNFPCTSAVPISTPDRVAIAGLRADLARVAGAAFVLRSYRDERSRCFATRSDVSTITQQGPATPDHVIRTKHVPMLGRDVDAYAHAYHAYFERYAHTAKQPKTILDAAPRVILDAELGILCAGRSAKDATIVGDIYQHTIDVISRANLLGGYLALPEGDLFDMEYWDLEQAKLKSGGTLPVFTGEVALVTGAASGIGKACVARLLARGAAVVGVDINRDIEQLHRSENFLGMVCDVTDAIQRNAALDTAVERFGGVDMLILNAGIFPGGCRIEQLSDDAWRKVLSINLDANLAWLRECYPLLKHAPRRGRVVIVGSKNVSAPGPGAAAYSASKAALNQLARVTALEWGKDGIRINSVHPNQVFDTALWTDEVLNARAAHYGLTVEQYKRNNVLGAEVTSMDVAEMVAEMCGPLFAKTTGAQVPIDGGNERVI